MGKVFVFGPRDSENDYSTMGLSCVLKSTECTFKETGNGDSILNLSHPIDEDGRYLNLVRGNILLAPVPVRTTPEIQNGTVVTTVWTYKVKSGDLLTSANQRTLYKKNSTSGGKMHVLDAGKVVTVVEKPSGVDNTLWKVKSDYGTGWMMPSGLEEETQHIIDDNASSIESVQSPWKIMPQLFRIYDVNKSLDSVQVMARHISYDLLYNITNYKSDEAVALQTALNQVLSKCDDPDHGFTAYTNVGNEQAGLDYVDKNPIEALLDPENGICARFDVGLVRDNHDLYFLHDPGINRGVIIRYGKNMTGIEFEESDDEVVTRIIPVGENKDGTPLYLEDGVGTWTYGELSNGSRGEGVRTMQSLLVKAGYSVGSTGVDGIFGSRTQTAVQNFTRDHNPPQTSSFGSDDYDAIIQFLGMTGNGRYIDSPNFDLYPVPHTYVLKCENCKVNDKEEGAGRIDVATARARMREQALKMFEEGCDNPKIKMRVEFQNLGDTEEYAEYKNLENCFLFDYVIVHHPRLLINVTARIVGIEWDVLAERMNNVEIGEVGQTMANTGITSWQIPSGFSGSKISFGTIGAGQLADGSIATRNVQANAISADHIQSNTINSNHIVSGAITALKISSDAIESRHIKADAIKATHIDSDQIQSRHIQANAINADKIKSGEITTAKLNAEEVSAWVAEIGKAQITTANIDAANINFADVNSLVAQIIDVISLSAENATFDFATAQKLLANALIVKRAVEEKVYIENLVATDASFVSATIGDLVLGSSSGKYYRVYISNDGKISTEEVTVTPEEIAAGKTKYGNKIVGTQANIEELNAKTIDGGSATLIDIFADAIETGDLRSNTAFIASARLPELYTTAVKALEDDMVFSADSSIQFLVGDYARRFNSGTRNYIPGSIYLRDAIAGHYNYNNAVVGTAIVGFDKIGGSNWSQTSFDASGFTHTVVTGGYLLLTENNTRAVINENSYWNVVRRPIGNSVMCRLDGYTANTNVNGVLRLAYELNGAYYPFDRIGTIARVDAILTNEYVSSGGRAVTNVTISTL